EHSYAPERAGRPDTVELWHKIETTEDPEWTRRYHSIDPNEKAFGGRVEIEYEDGATLVDEIAVADDHPLGARPFARANYVETLKTLAEGIVCDAEQARLLARAANLDTRPVARANVVEKFKPLAEGIVSDSEQARFLDLAENLESLDAKGVAELSFTVDGLAHSGSKGIF